MPPARRLLAALAAVLLTAGGAVLTSPLAARAATCTATADSGPGSQCPADGSSYTDPNILGSSSIGPTYVLNDVWSPPSGFTNGPCASGDATPCQEVDANGPESWSVTANLPDLGGQVLTYPDTQQIYTQAPDGSHPSGFPDPITGFAGLYSQFADTPAGGTGNSYDVGYDIWGGSVSAQNDNWADEVMIWTSQDNRGGCGGATPDLTGIQFGGTNGVPVQSWNLYNYGSERIWCSTSINENSGSVDVYGMLHYLMAPNYTGPGSLPADYGLNAIEYGVENCYTSGFSTFSLSKFTLATGTGGGSGQQQPAVTTSAATSVTSAGATLNGTVNPEGADASYKFDYGTTTAYGHSTTGGDAGAGTSAVSESSAVTGLSAGTTYHYRLEATNSAGTSYGPDQAFTTTGGGSGGAITVTASVTNAYQPVNLKTYVIDGGKAGGSVVTGGAYASPQFTLTPAASGSLLLAGAYNAQDGTAITPAASEARDDSGGTANAWLDGHYTGTVTAGTGVTLGGTDNAGWNAWSGYEAEPAAAGASPVIDATTPAAAAGSGSSATTASFSPPAGALLVAIVQSDGSAAQAVTMSSTGQALTWTQAGTTFSAGYEGTEAVYTATVPGGGGGTQQAPAATTNAASGVSASGATLNGSVNPEGADASYKFDYGTSTSYGSSTAAGDAGAGSSAVSESAALTGLAASTTYHYRIEATNSGGTTYGADQTFTTSAASGSGTVVYDATGPSGAGARAANAGTLSWTHTTGAGSDTALVAEVTVGVSDDTGCSLAVKDGSTAMTRLGTVHDDSQHAGFLAVFGLAGVPAGTSTLTATVTGCAGGTPLELTGGSESFTGVSQSAPFGTAVTAYGSGAAPQVTVTTASPSDKLAAFAASGSAISSAASPGVSRFIANEDGNSGAGNSAGQTLASTGAAQAARWSAASDWWGAAGVEVLHD